MNSRDFEPNTGNTQDQASPKVNGHFDAMADFDPQGYPQSFMPMQGNPGMFYQPYMSQFMPYPYPFSGSGFRNSNQYDRKGYHGRKKHQNYGPSTTQVVYAKKAKPMNQEEKKNENDQASITTDEKKNGQTSTQRTMEKLPHKIEKAQFFVIKSYSEEDVHKAIKNNVWCSTKEGNVKLHNAFVTANGEYPIYLLFSVNSSGHFVGVAEMKSTVDFEKNFEGWGQSHKWKGLFKISWIYIKDIPNRELRHLKNDLNEGKPVPNSRDNQEVPFEVGIQALEIFEKYKNQTSILDDFEYYEMQEKNQQH